MLDNPFCEEILAEKEKIQKCRGNSSLLGCVLKLGFTACAAGSHLGRKNLKRKKRFYSVESGGRERRTGLETGAM